MPRVLGTHIALNFVLMSEIVSPTCIGDFVMSMEVAVDVFDLSCKTVVSCNTQCLPVQALYALIRT